MGHAAGRRDKANKLEPIGNRIRKNAVFDRIGAVLLCDLQRDKIELMHITMFVRCHVCGISVVLCHFPRGLCEVYIGYRNFHLRHTGADGFRGLVRRFYDRLHNIIEGMRSTGQGVEVYGLVAGVEDGVKLIAELFHRVKISLIIAVLIRQADLIIHHRVAAGIQLRKQVIGLNTDGKVASENGGSIVIDRPRNDLHNRLRKGSDHFIAGQNIGIGKPRRGIGINRAVAAALILHLIGQVLRGGFVVRHNTGLGNRRCAVAVQRNRPARCLQRSLACVREFEACRDCIDQCTCQILIRYCGICDLLEHILQFLLYHAGIVALDRKVGVGISRCTRPVGRGIHSSEERIIIVSRSRVRHELLWRGAHQIFDQRIVLIGIGAFIQKRDRINGGFAL